MNKNIVLHLLPNAHLDPVWLWDWREGLHEGIATCRAVLDLMDEFPELTFIRGEAAVYAHLQRHAPDLFARVQRHVREGRWDAVGGVFVQPDTNLPATETFVRHFLRGIRYFRDTLGVRIRAGWAADSFGHSAGLPDILAAAGIESYAFTRPSTRETPIPLPAFWWQGAGGSRVLAYRPPVGWYGCERDEISRRLDDTLAHAASSPLANIGVFYGLGNHGGGPSRRQIEDIRRWTAAHPEVTVRHGTLHGLFEALHREIAARGRDFLPVHTGELNFCLRGCYASAAKIKFAFRKTEAALSRAETAAAAVSALTGAAATPLHEPWDGLLFNSFHDVVPGTLIERACDDQLAWLGHVRHVAATTETDALTRLAGEIDTRVKPARGDRPSVVPILVWNPHPHPFHGHVELEEHLDGRPLFDYLNRPHEVPIDVRDPAGHAIPFQEIQTECTVFPHLPWRKRVAIPVTLPALGWAVYTLGLGEGGKDAKPPPPKPVPSGVIRNGFFSLSAKAGGRAIRIRHADGRLFTTLALATVADPWGSWGGMDEEPESLDLSTVRHVWMLTAVDTLEQGSQRAVLATRWTGGRSELELRLTLWCDRPAVDLEARVLWNERSARLKLTMANAGDSAEYEVPGGTVSRGSVGEVPGGRWVRTGALGFASDALYNFNLKKKTLQATICRASRYANDTTAGPDALPWMPVVDRGELKFKALLTSDRSAVPRLAAELERPPITLPVPASPGKRPRTGSVLRIGPGAELLALKPAEDGKGLMLRLMGAATRRLSLTWLGEKMALGLIRKGEIATWRLARGKALRVNAVEEPIAGHGRRY